MAGDMSQQLVHEVVGSKLLALNIVSETRAIQLEDLKIRTCIHTYGDTDAYTLNVSYPTMTLHHVA